MALIYVDAWGIKNGPHGISRYCRSLIPPLVAAGARHRFVILRPRQAAGDRLDPSATAREVEIALPQTDWATLAFRPILEPVFRRHGRPDLYHSLFHMLPLALARGSRGPRRTIVTLHDLICLDIPSETTRSRAGAAWAKRFDRFVIPYALRHADHVICVSEATRRRAVEFVPLERSTTIHHGVDRQWFDRAPIVTAWERPRPYVAALGTPRPYKNVACIARAVVKASETIPTLKLVLIGGDGALDEELKHDLGDRLIVTGRIDDRELHAIVQSALLFVVASRVEGFGLPLLEAMAISTPVAGSDIPALREVGGDAALWFSPDNPGELAGIIDRVAVDSRLRVDAVEGGRARAAAFTWPAAAAATIDVYENALAREGSA